MCIHRDKCRKRLVRNMSCYSVFSPKLVQEICTQNAIICVFCRRFDKAKVIACFLIFAALFYIPEAKCNVPVW